MAADTDWLKLAVQSGFSLLSGAVGLVVGIWHAGKRSGKQEAEFEVRLRTQVDDRLQKAIDDMKASLAAAMDNRELLVSQFHESFNGIRRQIDENKLHTEENFVRKDDFRDFRDEYRVDQKRVHDKLDRLIGNAK